MSNPTYANIFNILKPIEELTRTKSGYFSFSCSGKDQNLTFRLQFSGQERGQIKYEQLEQGERHLALEMQSAGRPNCIIEKDITAITEQMAVLEVSKGVTDVITAIAEGMRRMEVANPVFALNRAIDSKNTQRAEYMFGIAAYVLNDQYEPVGRISLSITVFKMSQLERTSNLIRKAQEERELAVLDENGLAPQKPVSGHSSMTADCRTGNNDRYKITAMIQPGSPAMEQLLAKEQLTKATTEFTELVNNKLPLNNVHGMKDTSAEQWEAHGFVMPVATGGGYEGTVKANVPDEAEPYSLGNESVCIDPELLAILDGKAPKFDANLMDVPQGDYVQGTTEGMREFIEGKGYKLTDMHGGMGVVVKIEDCTDAEYIEQTKNLHITPDPTAELGYTATLQNGDTGVVDPNHVVK